jgi:hypothetical protein
MNNLVQSSDVPRVQRVAAVLWPSFIMAGVATTFFFAFLDPLDLLGCQGEPPFGRHAAYSIGFFLFWLLTAGSSLLTAYFLKPVGLVGTRA